MEKLAGALVERQWTVMGATIPAPLALLAPATFRLQTSPLGIHFADRFLYDCNIRFIVSRASNLPVIAELTDQLFDQETSQVILIFLLTDFGIILKIVYR